jgi:DNA polymerase III subunit alpha
MALFIDTETNGFPNAKNLNLKWGDYPFYKLLDRYNNARIVQLSYMITDNEFNQIELIDHIIKRDNFDINNSVFHGITNDISDNGIEFDYAFEEFYNSLIKVTHIIAHNIAFDINVIKSELYRRNKIYIINEIDKKILLCTMKHTKGILKINNQYGRYKNPSLNEIYRFAFNKDMDNAHNSKYDVINMHAVIKKMHDDNILNYSID